MLKILKHIVLLFFLMLSVTTVSADEFTDKLVNDVTWRLIELNWWKTFNYAWYDIKTYLSKQGINTLSSYKEKLSYNTTENWPDALFDIQLYWYIPTWVQLEIAKENEKVFKQKYFNKMKLLDWWTNQHAFSTLYRKSLSSQWRSKEFNVTSDLLDMTLANYNEFDWIFIWNSISDEKQKARTQQRLWDWLVSAWMYDNNLWWLPLTKTLAKIIPDMDRISLEFINSLKRQTWWLTVDSFYDSINASKFVEDLESPLSEAIIDLWFYRINPSTPTWYFLASLLRLLNTYFLIAMMVALMLFFFAFASLFNANWDAQKNEWMKNLKSTVISLVILLSLLFWSFSLYTKVVIWTAMDEFWQDFLTKTDKLIK